MSLNYTLLEENQIFGENQLEIFKKYGTKSAITDYAILKGGWALDFNNEENFFNRTGYWWTKTPENFEARIVDYYGDRRFEYVFNYGGGIRPAIPYSSISNYAWNKRRDKNNLLKVDFGWYPQTIAEESLSNEFEADKSNCLKKFIHIGDLLYLYNGKIYTEVISNNIRTLYNSRTFSAGMSYLVEVEPVTHLVDEKNNIALIEKIVYSGIPFNHEENYEGDFENTIIGKYIKNFFDKDIEDSLNWHLEEILKDNLQKQESPQKQKEILSNPQHQQNQNRLIKRLKKIKQKTFDTH